MDRRSFLQLGLAGLIGLSFTAGATAADKEAPNNVKWQPNLQAAHKEAVKSGKPILLVFGADWCFFCHKLERETLNNRDMSQFINKEFVAVKLDLEKDKRVAKILGVSSLPATVIVNSDADLLANIVGYQKPAKYSQNLKAALRVHQELQTVSGEKSTTTK